MQFTLQSNEKLNLNSQQLHLKFITLISSSLYEAAAEWGKKKKKRVKNKLPTRTKAPLTRTMCPTDGRVVHNGKGAAALLLGVPPLKHGLGQCRRQWWGQAGQTANSREPTGSGHLWLLLPPQFGGEGAKEQKSKQTTEQQRFYIRSPHPCSRLWMSKNCMMHSSSNFFSAVKI